MRGSTRKRRRIDPEAPIVISDDDRDGLSGDSGVLAKEEQAKPYLVKNKRHEGRWELPESSDTDIDAGMHSYRDDADSSEQLEDPVSSSTDSGDLFQPSTAKLQNAKASLWSNSAKRKAAKKRQKSKHSKAAQKLQQKKQQCSPELTVDKVVTSRDVKEVLKGPKQAKRSPFFHQGSSSTASDRLKCFKTSGFKKVKLLRGGTTQLQPESKGPVSAHQPEPHLRTSPNGSLHQLLIPQAQNRIDNPLELSAECAPEIRAPQGSAANMTAGQVKVILSPELSEPQYLAPGKQKKATARRKSLSPFDRQEPAAASDPRPSRAEAKPEAVDQTGDWNPSGVEAVLSSEGEGGVSPQPSSNKAEASDSPQHRLDHEFSPPSSPSPSRFAIHEMQGVAGLRLQSSAARGQRFKTATEQTRQSPSVQTISAKEAAQLGQSQEACPTATSPMNDALQLQDKKLKAPALDDRHPAISKCEELLSKRQDLAASPEARVVQIPETSDAMKEMTEEGSGSVEPGSVQKGPQQKKTAADIEAFRRLLLAKADKRSEEKRQGSQTCRPGIALSTRAAPAQKAKPQGPPAKPPQQQKPGSGTEDMKRALWEPPASPYCLIEEILYEDPWKLLVACMLLNKTSGRAVRKIMWRLFELAPTPEAGALADPEEVSTVIRPLGLFRKRAQMFKRFSREYLEKDWTDPRQLHGIGQYAYDAYTMFCRGKWREMSAPEDKDLLKYYKWIRETGGQGLGFEREVFVMPSGSESSLTSGPQGVVDICSPAVQSKCQAEMVGNPVD